MACSLSLSHALLFSILRARFRLWASASSLLLDASIALVRLSSTEPLRLRPPRSARSLTLSSLHYREPERSVRLTRYGTAFRSFSLDACECVVTSDVVFIRVLVLDLAGALDRAAEIRGLHRETVRVKRSSRRSRSRDIDHGDLRIMREHVASRVHREITSGSQRGHARSPSQRATRSCAPISSRAAPPPPTAHRRRTEPGGWVTVGPLASCACAWTLSLLELIGSRRRVRRCERRRCWYR